LPSRISSFMRRYISCLAPTSMPPRRLVENEQAACGAPAIWPGPLSAGCRRSGSVPAGTGRPHECGGLGSAARPGGAGRPGRAASRPGVGPGSAAAMFTSTPNPAPVPAPAGPRAPCDSQADGLARGDGPHGPTAPGEGEPWAPLRAERGADQFGAPRSHQTGEAHHFPGVDADGQTSAGWISSSTSPACPRLSDSVRDAPPDHAPDEAVQRGVLGRHGLDAAAIAENGHAVPTLKTSSSRCEM